MSTDTAALGALHGELRDRLMAFTTSDEWAGWLAGARQFHRYSPTNQLLLMTQGAEGHVASYRTWQRIPDVNGNPCQVRRHERGLIIRAPLAVTHRETDEATGEPIVVAGDVRAYRSVKLFHQSQLVAAPDLRPQPRPTLLTGPDRWQHVWKAVCDQLGDEGYPVELHTASPGETWNGRTHFDDGFVEVMDHLAPPQRVKTLLHEWSHVALQHSDVEPGTPRARLEVEAESATFLLCRTIGLDSASYSIPYVAGWAGGDPARLEDAATRILHTTATMIDTLESRLAIDLTPDLFSAAPGPATRLPVSARTPHQHPSMQPPDGPRPDGAPSAHAPAVLQLVRAPFPAGTPVVLHDVLNRLLPADWVPLLAATAHLDDPSARSLALGLCLDAGYDTASTATTLIAAGADPIELRRSMKHSFVAGDGIRRLMFDNIDAAFRGGRRPQGLDDEQRSMLEDLDVDDVELVTVAARQLKAELRPAEIADVLRHYGVAEDDLAQVVQTAVLTPTARPGAAAEVIQSPFRYAVSEHDDLLRRVIDDGRDPVRIAALASGLGMSYGESVAACARLGLDPEITAAVALRRRDGHVTLAADDLAKDWTAVPPSDGWSRYLGDDPATAPPNSAAPGVDRTVLTVLDQWRNQLTAVPSPSMT